MKLCQNLIKWNALIILFSGERSSLDHSLFPIRRKKLKQLACDSFICQHWCFRRRRRGLVSFPCKRGKWTTWKVDYWYMQERILLYVMLLVLVYHWLLQTTTTIIIIVKNNVCLVQEQRALEATPNIPDSLSAFTLPLVCLLEITGKTWYWVRSRIHENLVSQ